MMCYGRMNMREGGRRSPTSSPWWRAFACVCVFRGSKKSLSSFCRPGNKELIKQGANRAARTKMLFVSILCLWGTLFICLLSLVLPFDEDIMTCLYLCLSYTQLLGV